MGWIKTISRETGGWKLLCKDPGNGKMFRCTRLEKKSTMKTEAEFKTFFDTTLRQEILLLEEERKKVARKVWWINFGGIAAILLSLVLFLVIFILALMLAIGVVFGWVFLYKRAIKDFKSQFKEVVIRKVVGFLGPNLSYQPEARLDHGTYMASGIFPRSPDRYHGDDYVDGTLDKTALRFSELHTEYKTESRDSKGNTRTHWHTIFRGLFFVADFNKTFQGKTLVLPDAAERMFGKLLGQMFQSWNKGRGELIKLEDPDFEKKFVVYGTDQIEARYILSMSLVKRILDFTTRCARSVHLSFFDNKVAVAVSYDRALFEPQIFSTLLDFGLIKSYYDDMSLAIGIVEELSLNTRIWSK